MYPNGQNQLGYPYPKWHPYYGWGFGPGAPPQPTGMIGDPNIRPPGNWFGHPVVGDAGPYRYVPPSASLAPEATVAIATVGGAGLGYLITRSVLGVFAGAGLGLAAGFALPILIGGMRGDL